MARITLETNGTLTIRQLGLDDAKDIYPVIKSEDNFFRNWIDKSVVTKKIEDVKVFLMQEMPKIEQQKEVLFTINDKMGFCGIAGFYSTDKANNKTELVIWITKRAKTVQNYNEIIDAMLKFGFNDMLYNRIQSKTLSTDFASAGVLKKLGFKAEGTEKAGLLTSDKTYVDLAIYAILKPEYISHAKFAVRASKIFQRKHKRDLIK